MHQYPKKIIIILFSFLLYLSACQNNHVTRENIEPNDDLNQDFYHFTYDRFNIDPYLPSENNPLTKMLEQDLNIQLNINVTVGQYSYWARQFNSRIALGDFPDLVLLNRSDLIKHAQDGVIIPLDEYLKNNRTLKNRLNKQEWLLSSVNQRIYGFPMINQYGPYTAKFIRKDWLDNLNLKMPETTEQFYDVLHAFTFNDPNRSGYDDTIGFTTDHLEFGTLSTITNAFGLPQFAATSFGVPQDWIDEQGVLHFGPISNQYKEYLIYMNKLMEANVIHQDINAQSFSEYKQKMIHGQAGVVALFLPQFKMFEGNTWLREIKEMTPEAEWVYLPPIKGPNGYFGNNAHSLSSTFSVALTKKVLEKPGKVEKALDLLDFMFRNGFDGGEGGQFIDFGLEGTHHIRENQDVIKFLPQYFEDQGNFMLSMTMWGFPHHHDLLKMRTTDNDFELFKKMEHDRRKDIIVTNYYYGALPFLYKGDDYIRKMSLKFIFGQKSFDHWDDYVRTLNEQYRYELVQEIRRNELKDLGFLIE